MVLDSGFCVLKGLIELKKIGLFACTVIKKRWYWPVYVPGEAINAKFTELGMGKGKWLVISGKLSG